jgi:hypothetical protein
MSITYGPRSLVNPLRRIAHSSVRLQPVAKHTNLHEIYRLGTLGATLGAPVNLFESVYDELVILSWDAVTNASFYRVTVPMDLPPASPPHLGLTLDPGFDDLPDFTYYQENPHHN